MLSDDNKQGDQITRKNLRRYGVHSDEPHILGKARLVGQV